MTENVKMKQGFFITGTDTGVGKTWATLALMHYFKQQGHSVVGMKPVAAGCEWAGKQLKNEDAVLLQEYSSVSLDYKEINPYALEMPVAPHLAARENVIDLDVIVTAFQKLQEKAEVVIVEGAGGWLVPLNEEKDLSAVVKALDLPVILVVAIKLGCINHARLTLQQLAADEVQCAGWFAMCLDADMACIEENIESIASRVSVPLLGVFPYTEKLDVDSLASQIIL